MIANHSHSVAKLLRAKTEASPRRTPIEPPRHPCLRTTLHAFQRSLCHSSPPHLNTLLPSDLPLPV
ncbi:BQ5605_C003g02415 [Microbotryum silenes-dioicae]|uniref:BQ5605_C003g02415 protein n=1 Tax=Microbotryum silenes-dioicae TaxID=796604 RepID=A0A2X0M1K6_9BASI|nr:BQ5605_C003g02415 [Microbotryum silenes-dioicae]